jgi:uncharacterized protein YjaZ
MMAAGLAEQFVDEGLYAESLNIWPTTLIMRPLLAILR